jgi:hypothetical protein
MRGSAVRSVLHSAAHGALPLMAHPHRWAARHVMQIVKPFLSVVCGLVLIAMIYLLALPPFCAWCERRGISGDLLGIIEPNYQRVVDHVPWLQDYYTFCDAWRRTSEPPDVGLE